MDASWVINIVEVSNDQSGRYITTLLSQYIDGEEVKLTGRVGRAGWGQEVTRGLLLPYFPDFCIHECHGDFSFHWI